MAEAVLRIEELSHSFGGIQAVNGCSFALEGGCLGALIGPNGAGKTTVINVVAGALEAQAGRVHFGGVDITGWPTHRVASLGLIRTYQISREFAGLSVIENLMITAPRQDGERVWNALFRPNLCRRQDAVLAEKAHSILAEFGLFGLRDEYARHLSGGQKRLLELARAVMAEPVLLLLDEPMAGVNPALLENLCEHLLRLREAGVSMLLVEHNLGVVDQICDHVIVMDCGRTLATGRMEDLRKNPEVVRAYLTGAGSANTSR
jgi:ABC-type branched-subunit amino acid transport system ATPase component